MLVNKVKLNNYRNYQTKEINFDPNLNIIVGNNGIGKTNILESLIVISNSKSFRTLNDQNLIKKETEYARIECFSDEGVFKVVINQNGKTLFINNLPIKRTSEFIGKLNCVLFKPSDLDIFNHSPKERRRLLDLEIGKVSKEYLAATLSYNLLLKDKNRILKEERINQDYLDIINKQMIPQMAIIIKNRQEFTDIINSYLNLFYKKIANIDAKITMIYDNCSEIEQLKDMIDRSKDRDIYYHYATQGTHHEDYHFIMDGYDLNEVASQGQTRIVLISFKLALAAYIKKKTSKVPILLLDDILSELDIDNRQRLLKILPRESQVIITGTDLSGMNIKNNFNLIELK